MMRIRNKIKDVADGRSEVLSVSIRWALVYPKRRVNVVNKSIYSIINTFIKVKCEKSKIKDLYHIF